MYSCSGLAGRQSLTPSSSCSQKRPPSTPRPSAGRSRRSPSASHLASPSINQHEREPAVAMLLTIQASGSKRPLFFVHGLHGVMTLGSSLARALGPDQPIYAIHANG